MNQKQVKRLRKQLPSENRSAYRTLKKQMEQANVFIDKAGNVVPRGYANTKANG